MQASVSLNGSDGSKRRVRRVRRKRDLVARLDVHVNRRLLADHELAEATAAAKQRENDEDLRHSQLVEAFTAERDSDRSAPFELFAKRMEPLIQSLPLILHNLSTIADLFVKFIPRCPQKSSILYLLSVLCKDVHHEIYPHLPRLLQAVLGLVDPANAIDTQKAFECAGLMLSELAKTIVQRDPSLKLLRPFFEKFVAHRRDFVRRFAAEAFAPLLRLLPQRGLDKQVKKLVSGMAGSQACVDRHPDEQAEIVNGVALILFNTMRNVQSRLHSRAMAVLDAAFSTVSPAAIADLPEGAVHQRVLCLTEACALLVDFCQRDTVVPLWEYLLNTAIGDPGRLTPFVCAQVLELVHCTFSSRGYTRVFNGLVESIYDNIFKPHFVDETAPDWLADASSTEAARIELEAAVLAIKLWRSEHHFSRPCPQVLKVLNKIAARIDVSQLPSVVAAAFTELNSDPHAVFEELVRPVVVRLDANLAQRLENDSGTKPRKTPVKNRAKGKKAEKVADAGAVDHENPAFQALAAISQLAIRSPKFDLASVQDDLYLPSDGGALAFCGQLLDLQGLPPLAYTCALHVMHLCSNACDRFEPVLVNFVLRPSAVDAVAKAQSLALGLIRIRAVWDHNPQLRTELCAHLVETCEDQIHDPVALLAFAELVESDPALLSDEHRVHIMTSLGAELTNNLMSRSHSIRLGSVLLLRYAFPELLELRKPDDPKQYVPSRCDVLDTMVKIERTALDYNGERTFEMLFGRLLKGIEAGRVPAEYIDPISSFVMGQFHVAFEPLWRVATKAVQILGKQHFQKHLWHFFWRSLLHLTSLDADTPSSSSSSHGKHHKSAPLRGPKKTASGRSEDTALPVGSTASDGDKLYTALRDRKTKVLDALRHIMTAFCPLGKAVESKADFVVPLFFTFLRDEYYALREDHIDRPAADVAENAYLANHVSDIPAFTMPSQSTKAASAIKLQIWLKLISNFTKYRAGDRTDALYEVFERFLLEPDREVQKASLACLFKMRLPCLHGHHERLEAMQSESDYREAITGFNLSEVDEKQRPGFLRVLSRLLLTRTILHQKRSKKSKTQESRRTSVFNMFATVESSADLKPLLDVIFRSLPNGIDFDATSPEAAVQALNLEAVPVARISSIIASLEELIKSLGQLLNPFLDRIISVIIVTLKHTNSDDAAAADVEALDDEDAEQDAQAPVAAGAGADSDDEDEEEDEDGDAADDDDDDDDDDVSEEEMEVEDEEEEKEAGETVKALTADGKAVRDARADEDDTGSQAGKKQRTLSANKGLRQDCMRRLVTILGTFTELDTLKMWGPTIGEILGPSIELLPTSVLNAVRSPVLLQFAQALAHNSNMIEWGFVEACPALFSQTVRCGSSGLSTGRGAGPGLLNTVYDVIEHCFQNNVVVRVVVTPNMALMLDMLLARLQSGATSNTNMQVRKFQSRRELNILFSASELYLGEGKGRLVSEAERDTCSKLIDLLATFLRDIGAAGFGSGRKVRNSQSSAIGGGRVRRREELESRNDRRAPLLTTISGLLHLTSVSVGHLRRFARCLGACDSDPIYSVEARANLVAIFQVLGESEELGPLLEPIVPLLADLNAWEKRRVGNMDFDRRLEAYEKMGNVSAEWNSLQLLPLAHQAILDLNEDEYPLRSAAQHFLCAILARRSDPATVKDVVLGVIIPGIKAGLKTTNSAVRKAFVDLLRAVCEAANKLAPADVSNEDVELDLEGVRVEMFSDLARVVCQEEPEKDFFTSIVHLQNYRQSSYLAHLRACMKAGTVELRPTTLVHVLVPLTISILTHTTEAKDQHLKEEAALALGQYAESLPWAHYLSLISYLFFLATKSAELNKRLVKAACIVVDHYHFPHASTEKKLERGLANRVLKPLTSHLVGAKAVGSDKKIIRIQVAVAMIKVMRLLPERYLSGNLPRLLTNVADAAKSLDRDSREEARQVYVAIALELGPSFLKQIVESIMDALTEGYQLHVRGHVIHALLEGTEQMLRADLIEKRKERGQILPSEFVEVGKKAESAGASAADEGDEEADAEAADNSATPAQDDVAENASIEAMLNVKVCTGTLDELIESFVGVVNDELYGTIAEQKRSNSEYNSRVTKLVESHSSKALDILEILGRLIAFLPAQSVHSLTAIFVDRINQTSDFKTLRIAEEALRRIGLGIAKNHDVRVPHLLVYIHHIVSSEYQLNSALADAEAVAADGGQHRAKRFKPTAVNADGIPIDELEEAEAMLGGRDRARSSKFATWVIAESSTEVARAAEKVAARNAYAGIHLVEAEPQMTGKNRFDNDRARNAGRMAAKTKKNNRHLMVEHALSLLLGAIRAKRILRSVPAHREMIDPLVELLAQVCKESRASRTTVLALRVLSRVMPWKLPSMRANVGAIVKGMMRMMRKIGFSKGIAAGGASGSAVGTEGSSGLAADTTQECIKTLTLVLRDCTYFKFPKENLPLLVLLAQHNLSVVSRQQPALTLVRNVVDRKLVVPEIYELMNTLAEQVFTSSNNNVRQNSSKILVEFFLNYPLSTKRLRQHLDLLVGNLDFDEEDGRIAGLSMLRAILTKFPEEVLEEVAQLSFFPLVLRLVNDESSECRQHVGVAIKTLVSRVGTQTVNEFLTYIDAWLAPAPANPEAGLDINQRAMQRAAAQVAGLFAEVDQGKLLSKARARALYDALLALLDAEVAEGEAASSWEEYFLEQEERFGAGEGWLTSYHSLLSLHKLCMNCASLGPVSVVLTARKDGAERTSVMERLVFTLARQHPHLWVRLGALRLIGQILAEIEPTSASLTGRSGKALALSTAQDVYHLATLHCVQLNRPSLDERLADQAVKNLVWIASVLIELEPEADAEEAGADADEAEADEAEADEVADGEDKSGISWLVHRLSFTARVKRGSKVDFGLMDLRQCSVFKLFAIMATHWQSRPARLRHYLVPMLSPLVRVKQSSEVFGLKLQAPQLAAECLDLIEQVAGTAAFVKAYSQVQRTIDERRSSRKRERAVERVLDPSATQRARAARTAQQKAAKKRKIKVWRQHQGR